MSRKARRLVHFSDPRIEVQVDELVRAQNAEVEASEGHEARKDNPHEVTPEQIGAETPAGAQAKADAAEASSKAYTDQHSAATTGVHGVGASEVESKAGAQTRVDAHSSATSGVHGVGTNYVAKTSRADQWPDWDDVQNKPASYPPGAHAASHASGGPDPITPASIGAETPTGAQAKADAARAAAEATAQAALDTHRAASPIDHPYGSVTDSHIGNRTADQAQAPTGSTGTLTQFLSWLVNRIKAITGATNWYDAPATTLAAAKSHMDAAAPHSGHETPSGAQAKVNSHAAATTGIHGVATGYVAKTSRRDQLPSWNDIPDKPSTFPPSSHTHDDRYYTESEADARYVFQRKVSEFTPGAGWRRFAYGQSNCSYNGALFKLRYTIAGKHGVIFFFAGITYGRRPKVDVIERTTYGGDSGITALRLLYRGTYDQPYLEFYTDAAGISVEVEMLDNSSAGWTLQTISSGSLPTGYSRLEVQMKGTGSTVPRGVIVMWSGPANQIPDGWALCDGTNGTPDLRDRFIVGAGGSYAVGATGGEAQHTLTVNELPSHSHAASTGSAGNHSHTGTTASAGAHNHTSSGDWYGHPGGGYAIVVTAYQHAVEYRPPTSTNGAHTHAFTTGTTGAHTHAVTVSAAGGGAAHENRPPYYALCFIMKL